MPSPWITRFRGKKFEVRGSQKLPCEKNRFEKINIRSCRKLSPNVGIQRDS